MSDYDALKHQIEVLSPWLHNIHLPGDIQTAPDHPLGDFPAFKWEVMDRKFMFLNRIPTGRRSMRDGTNLNSFLPSEKTGWTSRRVKPERPDRSREPKRPDE